MRQPSAQTARRRGRRTLSVALSAAALSAIFVTPAEAQSTPGSAAWSTNPLTGYCGRTNGGYVIAGQSLLYAYGTYNDGVDNLWGTNSNVALRNYQVDRGLVNQFGTPDGCAGPQTWAKMQAEISYWSTVTNCGATGNAFRLYKGTRAAYFTPRSTWATDLVLGNVPNAGAVTRNSYRFQDGLVTC